MAVSPHPPCPHCGAKSHIHRYLDGGRLVYRCTAHLTCGRTHRPPSPKPPGRPRVHASEAERMRKARAEMSPEQKAAEVVKRRERRWRAKRQSSE